MPRPSPNASLAGVPRRRLVRILAVSQVLDLAQVERQPRRRLRAFGRSSECRAGVRRRVELRRAWRRSRRRSSPCARMPSGRESKRKLRRWPSGPLELDEDVRVVGRVDHDEHVLEILGGRSHHARPADVDFLDERAKRDIRLRRRVHERIQVDDDQIDRRDVWVPSVSMSSLRLRRARMPPWTAGCSVFTRPSMISGNPVTAEMRGHRHTALLEGARRPAGGHELESPGLEGAREGQKAGLVRNARGRLYALSGIPTELTER